MESAALSHRLNEPRTHTSATSTPSSYQKGKKVVIVTGSRTKAGRAIIQAFAHAGAQSIHVFGGTKSTTLNTEVETLQFNKDIPMFVQTDGHSCTETCQKISEMFGKWDVLIRPARSVRTLAETDEISHKDSKRNSAIGCEPSSSMVTTLMSLRNQDAEVISVQYDSISKNDNEDVQKLRRFVWTKDDAMAFILREKGSSDLPFAKENPYEVSYQSGCTDNKLVWRNGNVDELVEAVIKS
jgi:hypothetical protein